MFKRVLLILCLTSVCSFIIGALEGFALDNKQNLEKDAKLELAKKETKSEPHFDLPRKDAKDQCKEVERVYEECYNSNESFPKINNKYKCGNVLFESLIYYTNDEYGGSGEVVFIYDNKMKLIGASGKVNQASYGMIKKVRKKQADMSYFEIEKKDISKALQKKNYQVFLIENCFPTTIN